jgi:hypothetical protein
MAVTMLNESFSDIDEDFDEDLETDICRSINIHIGTL